MLSLHGRARRCSKQQTGRYGEGKRHGIGVHPFAGIRRLLAICLILLKQVLAYGPFRLLFGSTEPARQVVGKYLAPAGPGRVPRSWPGRRCRAGAHLCEVRPVPEHPAGPGAAEFCEAFKALQDRVPPFPFSQVQRELRQELQRDPGEVFSEFDETAMAARRWPRSTGPAPHRGRSRGQGAAAGHREAMVADLFIMLRVARLIERFVPRLRKNRPVMLVQESRAGPTASSTSARKARTPCTSPTTSGTIRACGSRRSTGVHDPQDPRDGAYPGRQCLPGSGTERGPQGGGAAHRRFPAEAGLHRRLLPRRSPRREHHDRG